MNFFEQQEHARRLSRRLTLLFALSVAVVVLVLNAIAILVGWRQTGCLALTAVVLACIFGGSLYRMSQLGDAGATIAQMCGGRRILPSTQEPAERRLLNVVEEMALAAGIPVPQVYVLDAESSINAFAAGLTTAGAAVTVTRGTLEKLTRDELQGVIGHEFSHILNGDMRLNVRMIGLLAGIELIGLIGQRMLRSMSGVRGRGGAVVLLAGLGALVAGSIGKLCADIIRAAVSRQREYLADASAVQFTRNPDGIAGALARVEREGSGLDHAAAGEIAHMCLGGVSAWSSVGPFATHPPILERISRLVGAARAQALRRTANETSGKLVEMDPPRPMSAVRTGTAGVPPAAVALAGAAAASAASRGFTATGTARQAPRALSAQGLVESVGRVAPQHLDRAAVLLASIPQPLDALVRTERGAKALVAALLYGETKSAREETEIWRAQGEAGTADLSSDMWPAVDLLGQTARLPLLDLALPALKAMPASGRSTFLEVVHKVIAADSRMTFFEFVLLSILEGQLAAPSRPPAVERFSSLALLREDAALVLSLFAAVGGADGTVFQRASAHIGCTGPMTPRERITLGALRPALERLRQLAPLAKPALIKACAEIVLADGSVNESEFELMRAVCAAIDSPMPPVIENADVPLPQASGGTDEDAGIPPPAQGGGGADAARPSGAAESSSPVGITA